MGCPNICHLDAYIALGSRDRSVFDAPGWIFQDLASLIKFISFLIQPLITKYVFRWYGAFKVSQSLKHPKSQDLYLWTWRARSMLWDRCFIKEYIRKETPGLKLEISGLAKPWDSCSIKEI